MMYLVSTLAAGAAAVELRGLAVDHGTEKIQFNGHGFSNGQILKPSGTIGTTLLAAKMYVVDSATTDDFKLKTFKVDDAKGLASQVLEADGGGAETLTAYGSKKCKIESATKADNKVTCAAATTFAATDELIFYCDGTGDDCKVDGGANLDLANGKAVWAVTANAKSFELAKIKPYADGGTKIAIGTDILAQAKDKVWLLSKDTASIYAVAPKTLIADGGKWDTTANEGNCGNWACGLADGKFYHYTAGTVATAGLTTDTVYHAQVATDTPWKFELNAVAVSLDELAKKNTDNVAVTTSGKGDSYQLVSDGRVITGSTTPANTITVKGNNGGDEYKENVVMMFWCSDKTTPADCDYKVAGMTSGSTFKVKTTANDGVAGTALTLKAATGTDVTAIAVSGTTTGKTKGFALIKSSNAAVIFPAAASGAGSAARSFAMLGSAVAMATAFLLA